MNMRKLTGKAAILAAAICAAAAFPSWAATYYHKGSDGYGTSSFNQAKVSNTVGWSTSPNGSVVSSISDWAGSDFIVSGSANSVRIPATDADITFAGKSLAVNDSTIAFKRASNNTALTRNVTIADFRFTGTGGILAHGESKNDHGSQATVFCIKGGITIADGAVMTLDQSFNSNNDTREFVVDSAVSGGETSAIAFRIVYSSGISNGTAPVTFNSLADFYGTLKIDSATTTPNFNLTVNGTFNGTVTSLPQNAQWARFDFDGLPTGKGVRIKGASPGAAVARLRLHSATADFTTPGLVVATFEDVSSIGVVENIGWNVQCSTSLDGTYSPVLLKAQTNSLGQVTLVTAENTYYKTGSDTGYNSSLPTSSALSSGWSKTPGGTAVTVAAADIEASDFIVSGGNVLRTCGTQMFGGRTLRLSGPGDGSSAQWLMKYNSDNEPRDTQIAPVTTVDRLVFSGGVVYPATDSVHFKLAGNIEIESGRSMGLMTLMPGNNTPLRRLEIAAPVTGGTNTTIDIFKVNDDNFTTQTGDTETVFDDLENFTGVFNDHLPAWKASDASYIHFAGKFGGRIGTMETNNIEFIVNYDGLPSGKGLRTATTTVPGKLKTKTVFYSSDVSKFMTDGTVLATFPSGTAVDPAAFVFEYASSFAGERFTMPPCRTESGANGEVCLVIDIAAPSYAKMVKDAQTDEYEWHFYLAGDNGTLGDDVTATCGKTVPDNSMVVLFASSEEFAAISANPGAAREYRLTAFTCTEDTDFSSVTFAPSIVAASGLTIDPAGHRVTAPAALANEFSTVSSGTAGSEFCVKVASGAETLSGPVISGAVRFVKAGAGTLYCAKAGQTYTGGNKVEAGLLSAPTPPADEREVIPADDINQGENRLRTTTTLYKADQHYFGAEGNSITVESGAGFDINSNYGYHIYDIVLNGGTLWNVQYSSASLHQSAAGDGVGFRLTDDSAMRFRSDILISGGDPINLGGHRLSIYCAIGSKYIHLKNSITNGTVELVKGDAAYNRTPDTGTGLRIAAAVDASDRFTLEDGTGLMVTNAFTIFNYTAKLPALYGWISLYTGQAQMTVTGTFRPEQRYFPGCTMAAGSTVDLRAWNFASWGAVKSLATESYNGGNIDFAGNVTIDMSGRSDLRELAAAAGESGVKGTYIFKWGEEEGADRPVGRIFRLDEATSQRYHFIYDNVGLRFIKTKGLIIYVR